MLFTINKQHISLYDVDRQTATSFGIYEAEYVILSTYLFFKGDPMFIINLTYVKPRDEIETFLSQHRAFLDHYYQKEIFLLSGPKEPRNGGIIICHAASQDDVIQIISEDPFFIHKVAEYEIVEFIPVKTAKDLVKYEQ